MPLSGPMPAAFSPDGCITVIYDINSGALAKIDSKRHVAFDSVQSLPKPIVARPVALGVEDTYAASFLLAGSTIQSTSYQAFCPPR